MAVVVTEEGNRNLSRKLSSSSFKLRSPSLNSLRLRRVFDIFDKNRDNMITVQELHQAFSLLGLEADLSDLDLTVKSFVKSGNTGLTFEDFTALHQSLNETLFGFDNEVEAAAVESTEDSDLSEAFKVFDQDGDGFISAEELQVVLGKLGLPEGGEIRRVEQMINSVDRNNDGRVDFFEFKDMMHGILIRNS